MYPITLYLFFLNGFFFNGFMGGFGAFVLTFYISFFRYKNFADFPDILSTMSQRHINIIFKASLFVGKGFLELSFILAVFCLVY